MGMQGSKGNNPFSYEPDEMPQSSSAQRGGVPVQQQQAVEQKIIVQNPGYIDQSSTRPDNPYEAQPEEQTGETSQQKDKGSQDLPQEADVSWVPALGEQIAKSIQKGNKAGGGGEDQASTKEAKEAPSPAPQSRAPEIKPPLLTPAMPQGEDKRGPDAKVSQAGQGVASTTVVGVDKMVEILSAIRDGQLKIISVLVEIRGAVSKSNASPSSGVEVDGFPMGLR